MISLPIKHERQICLELNNKLKDNKSFCSFEKKIWLELFENNSCLINDFFRIKAFFVDTCLTSN